MRHRFYLAELGRWAQRDPLGYVDGMSLYAYVQGMAIIAVDPYGLAGSQAGGSSAPPLCAGGMCSPPTPPTRPGSGGGFDPFVCSGGMCSMPGGSSIPEYTGVGFCDDDDADEMFKEWIINVVPLLGPTDPLSPILDAAPDLFKIHVCKKKMITSKKSSWKMDGLKAMIRFGSSCRRHAVPRTGRPRLGKYAARTCLRTAWGRRPQQFIGRSVQVSLQMGSAAIWCRARRRRRERHLAVCTLRETAQLSALLELGGLVSTNRGANRLRAGLFPGCMTKTGHHFVSQKVDLSALILARFAAYSWLHARALIGGGELTLCKWA